MTATLTERQALVAAIIARPDDDVRRLAKMAEICGELLSSEQRLKWWPASAGNTRRPDTPHLNGGKGMPKVHHIGPGQLAQQGDLSPRFSDDELKTLAAMFGIAGRVVNIAKAPGYAVSDCGRVFSRVPCLWRRAEPFREMKLCRHQGGYRFVRLHVEKRPSADTVHRLVAFAFLPTPSEGQTVVRHLDGDPANNVFTNLAWGTQTDNMADCIRHGRTNRGLKNPNAKLTPARVKLVRGLVAEGFSRSAVAAFFGVTNKTIDRACTGEHWADV